MNHSDLIRVMRRRRTRSEEVEARGRFETMRERAPARASGEYLEARHRSSDVFGRKNNAGYRTGRRPSSASVAAPSSLANHCAFHSRMANCPPKKR